MIVLETGKYHGYNVKFSPFHANLVACSTSQNYGFSGRGALFLFDFSLTNYSSQLRKVLEWPSDGLFDVCWSEIEDHVLWSGSADGFLQVWSLRHDTNSPVTSSKAHDKEIYCVEWNQFRADPPSVLSCSWDGRIKQWDAATFNCLQTFVSNNVVYSVSWSPLISSTFASASADGHLRFYDTRQLGAVPTATVNAGVGEALSCDWCKYNDRTIACSGTNGAITVWDTRWNSEVPLAYLGGHNRAVRKVRFDPHQDSIIGSVSYDFTTKFWDFRVALNQASNPLLMTFLNHREFAYGIDFNLHTRNLVVDCGWDSTLKIFSVSPLG